MFANTVTSQLRSTHSKAFVASTTEHHTLKRFSEKATMIIRLSDLLKGLVLWGMSCI